MMRIQIKNGLIIDPANRIEEKLDIFISEGRIAAIGKKPEGFTVDQVIDAGGCHVIPGLVDLRARLREPGQAHKGTIASETGAAVAGGVTTVCVPPDTNPVIDTTAVTELIYRRAKKAANARVISLAALTIGLEGEQISEMAALKNKGKCVGVSNARKPVKNNLILRRAMEYAASCGLTVFLHSEDAGLAGQGCAHEGPVALRLGLAGIPEAAETVAVTRDLMLVEQTGVHAHFCGISTARAAQMIARAQYDGLPVTADIAAHQLHLTEMDIACFNSDCHVRPPLRSQRDRDGLLEALAHNTVSAICSDHQPHDTDAKLAPFGETEPGISALETLLPLALRMVKDSNMSLLDVIDRLTHQPAKILGLDAGTLSSGAEADICIYDPKALWTVSPQTLLSYGHNTPFMGWELQGKVRYTLVDGRVVYQDNASR